MGITGTGTDILFCTRHHTHTRIRQTRTRDGGFLVSLHQFFCFIFYCILWNQHTKFQEAVLCRRKVMKSYDGFGWFYWIFHFRWGDLHWFFYFLFHCILILLRNLHTKFQEATLSRWKIMIQLGGFGWICQKLHFRWGDLHRFLNFIFHCVLI